MYTSDDLKNESGGTRTRAATDRKKTDGGRETRSETSNIETQQKSTIKTVQVDLILNSASGNGGDGKGSVSSVDSAKLQEDIDKMIEKMNSDGQVKVGDLKKLSDSLGALKTDSMNFAAVAGKATHPEPLDLTELQWDAVFRNNRALHGWFHKGNMLVKARKRAFQLKRNMNAEISRSQRSAAAKTEDSKEASRGDTGQDMSTEETGGQYGIPTLGSGPLPPLPPFYVWDDASVEVTEMTSALEKTMANQGFSSTAVKAAGGGGAVGGQASASLAVETEHSAASKELNAEQVNSIHVAYKEVSQANFLTLKFPRAAVEVDAYCLELTEECSVFATQFTLGGELTSSRLFHGSDAAELSAFKDSVKVAAGLSISTPHGSAGVSHGSHSSNETAEEEKKAQRSLRLAWQARGGDTLLCSNPPLWASTVKDYRLWRVMDQQGMVKMIDLVKDIHLKAGKYLENPETASKRESTSGGDDIHHVWDLLTTALRDPQKHPVAKKIKEFYEGQTFRLDEFNASLGQDGGELRLSEKISWPRLDLEQKLYVGLLCYKKKLISLD
ncbi:hypothetical protein PLICBS_010133 [Purpureocillium lilacinum]|uniref:uncharacterized protein n=1 Tax=Purpureocillium lilacinum TaxID=33203 RepID=UPI00208C9665|nr:hypothetical protein PLICBS_010133 [Purpureocillium lilacinum]